VLNALGGVLSLGLICALARHVGSSLAVPYLAAAGFVVSGAVSLLSVEAELVTIPSATTLLMLWGVTAGPPGHAGEPAYALLTGCGVALAVLAYLTGVYLVPVVIGGLLLQRQLA
jgi:hypothetical protein